MIPCRCLIHILCCEDSGSLAEEHRHESIPAVLVLCRGFHHVVCDRDIGSASVEENRRQLISDPIIPRRLFDHIPCDMNVGSAFVKENSHGFFSARVICYRCLLSQRVWLPQLEDICSAKRLSVPPDNIRFKISWKFQCVNCAGVSHLDSHLVSNQPPVAQR